MFRQSPLASPFNAFSTADEVLRDIDLTGRTAIVTGGASGLGLQMTRALAAAGAQVIVPARSPEKAQAALAGVENIEIAQIELMDLSSIDRFADAFLDARRPLDCLIHSAGIMAAPIGRDSRGNESQLAINHLAPFHLTDRLGPALKAAGSARVVSLSSRAHRLAGVDFNDPNFVERPYDPWLAYGQSKTADALFAVELDRRARAAGVRAFSVHPGSILTDLARHLSPEQVRAFGAMDEKGEIRIDPLNDLKTVQQGAATALWCATSPLLADLGGVYCEDCNVAPLREPDDPRKDGVRTWAADADLATRLWALSERLVGQPTTSW
ncbi:NAD(P)-dependent dehydrogenase, short-chain alcohol dehydrogenase family [Sphingomonas sp. NFR04]|uniref:oxidoreductase n=1 Tax=Sphingomonas sp. NFR04 TaxID=1566283 RepID=UPI0008ED61EB|nr:oxidoreductase [Sphingomonas sp. NFR04]SFK60265.1 NAD(P)-dependent dehydrogenase, short-chain alcohol dehydrogenase family [Sphingomonas sp. NFR04]